MFMLYTIGDYMNSKEYRKPEWVSRMEEIQKRLSGELVIRHAWLVVVTYFSCVSWKMPNESWDGEINHLANFPFPF